MCSDGISRSGAEWNSRYFGLLLDDRSAHASPSINHFDARINIATRAASKMAFADVADDGCSRLNRSRLVEHNLVIERLCCAAQQRAQ